MSYPCLISQIIYVKCFVFLQETQKEDTEHRYEDEIMEKDMLE